LSHANARLTVHGRAELIRRVVDLGRPVAHVVVELNVSRATGYKWLARWRREGPAGLADRSSRAHRLPGKTSPALEAAVLTLRAERKLGPARIGPLVGLAPSTVHAILRRYGLHRLAWLDRPTGQLIRRYERDRPGELVHVDVKKLGRIPEGGGWKSRGRSIGKTAKQKKAKIGFDYVHSMVDDHSRLAYSEILPDEKGATCAEFLLRAAAAFASRGINRIEEVITDNHMSYKLSHDFRDAIAALDARHLFIQPHCPWQNGKVERFNRTLAIEWAYREPFTSNDSRAAALAPWLEHYNTRRRHSALGGHPPVSRLPT